MKKNLRLGALTVLFLGLAALAGLAIQDWERRSHVKTQSEVVTIAEARWEHPERPFVPSRSKKTSKITRVRHDDAILVDYIAPYRDCSIPAADNAIAHDPRCEGLALSENGVRENEPLELDPH